MRRLPLAIPLTLSLAAAGCNVAPAQLTSFPLSPPTGPGTSAMPQVQVVDSNT